MAVSHLIQQGCRKIGIITGPATWWESKSRLEGWRRTLEQAGLEPDPSLVVEGNWMADSGKNGMDALLDRHSDIDGVFACNDSMALGVMHAVCRRGLSIPSDLLLVGYDNTPETDSYWPPLTSVDQGLLQAGQKAVEVLYKIIEAERNIQTNPYQHIIQPELIIRRSSMRDKI